MTCFTVVTMIFRSSPAVTVSPGATAGCSSSSFKAGQKTASGPAGNVLAQNQAIKLFNSASPNTQLAAAAISSTGGSQPHNNFQPYLCVDFIISLFGIFPSQT